MAKKEPPEASSAVTREAIVASMESLETWAMIFTFLVAIGVAGEFFVGFKQRTLSKLLRSADDAHALVQEQLIEEARAKAEKSAAEVAVATRDIETARRDAAEANARAAEANKLAEEERLARVRIEQRLAPRTLTAEQLARIAGAAHNFATTKLVFVLSDPSPEPTAIANGILRTLSNWIVGVDVGHDSARAVSGMLVEVKPEASDAEKHAADAIAAAIRGEGLAIAGPIEWQAAAMTGSFAHTGPQLQDAKLRLTIGTK
jgi:hypothetical protein